MIVVVFSILLYHDSLVTVIAESPLLQFYNFKNNKFFFNLTLEHVHFSTKLYIKNKLN